MLRDFRPMWILTGATAIFAVLALLPLPPAAARDGNLPAISRGGSVYGVWVAGAERERAAPVPGKEVFQRFGGRRVAQSGKVTPEKLKRWRSKSPEEKERIRERYRRWKDLSPERRERILEHERKWGKIPKQERPFFRQRREIFREAQPEEKRAIKKFFRHWRELPHEQRHALRRDMAEMRDLPVTERDERMRRWSFYNSLTPDEQKAVNRFLFSELPPGPKSAPPGSPRD